MKPWPLPPCFLVRSALATASTQSIKQADKGMALDDVEVTVTHVHDNTLERRIESDAIKIASPSTIAKVAQLRIEPDK